jgi:hypothetical protein
MPDNWIYPCSNLKEIKNEYIAFARMTANHSTLDAGFNALGRWTADCGGNFEMIAQCRDADGPMVDRALELVRQLIVKYDDIIIFGGLAVDYALRVRGSHLYPDGKRPDFDLLSTRSVDRAYELAEILQRAGFSDVGAIRAIHAQTMRVRTDFIYVADIGYVPESVFARIPTFEFQGMRVVHPDFQRMDMHLAFCYPLNGPPREDVFHRWQKDLYRFNLFEQFYPIALIDAPIPSTKIITGTLACAVTGDAAALTVALHGFAAYSVLRTSLDQLGAALGSSPVSCAAPHLKLSFPTERSLSVETPAGDVVHVASPEPDAAVAGLPTQWFDPYMDVYPETVQTGSIVVMSTRSRMIAATIVRAGAAQAYVVTPQYLLLWLMSEAHRSDGNAIRDVYRAYYAHTLEILREAENIFAKLIADESDPATATCLMDTFAHSPFAPTVNTLGTVNHDAAYVIKMANSAGKLRDHPPAVLNLPMDLAAILPGLPSSYYPGGGKIRPSFDYSANPLFHRGGAART